MRVIDCDRCGDTLTAPNDTELSVRLAAHFASEHDERLSEEDLEELLADEAYDAMDS
jgi:hypothetical protein